MTKPFFPVERGSAKSAERERAERIAALNPSETMTLPELELIEIYRAIHPTKRAALLVLARCCEATEG